MMKKIYNTPALEFVCIETKEDVLTISSEIDATRDDMSPNYGVSFPF